MSGNGQILRPGQQLVNIQHHPDQFATPATMLVSKEAGKDLHIFGGLTKLEHGALQIAGMMVIGGVDPPSIAGMRAAAGGIRLGT